MAGVRRDIHILIVYTKVMLELASDVFISKSSACLLSGDLVRRDMRGKASSPALIITAAP
jgi:hypothetical protein